MRSATLGFAVVVAIGLVALAVVAVTSQTTLVYTLGVKPALVAAELNAGDRVCQAPINLPRDAPFDRIGFLLGTYGSAGPAVDVEVRADHDGRRVASGRLPAGYPDFDDARTERVVKVGQVETEAPLRVCLINRGRSPVAAIGQAGIASQTTSATLEGEPIPNDITLNFRESGRSLAARLPDIAERAARFRAGWVTPIFYLLLASAVLIAAPLLLVRGLARAAEADADDQPSLDDRQTTRWSAASTAAGAGRGPQNHR